MPGGACYPRGRQESGWLSLCLSSCPINISPAKLRGALVASYHILMGQPPTSHPFSLSQGASPTKQPSASAAPPVLAPEHSPRPKRQHPSSDPMDSMPLGGTMSKATTEGPPSSKWQEVPSCYKVLKQSCSEAFSQDTSIEREARREYLKSIPPTSPWIARMICQRSSGVWLKVLSYWAWPSMRSRKYGRGQISCNKLTMPWGLYQKASSSS